MQDLGDTLGAVFEVPPTYRTSRREGGPAYPHFCGVKQTVFLPQDVLGHLDRPPF